MPLRLVNLAFVGVLVSTVTAQAPVAAPVFPPIQSGFPPCYVCGGDATATIGNPDVIIDVPPGFNSPVSQASCSLIAQAGVAGFLPPDACAFAIGNGDAQLACGCSNYVAPVAAPVPIPVAAPVDIPVAAPAPTPAATPIAPPPVAPTAAAAPTAPAPVAPPTTVAVPAAPAPPTAAAAPSSGKGGMMGMMGSKGSKGSKSTKEPKAPKKAKKEDDTADEKNAKRSRYLK